MSVLDDFARMGLYRKKAAEFQCLAEIASVPSTQRRFRTIARHYSELADREERADKARMVEHLEQLRLKRQQTAARLPGSGVQPSGTRSTETDGTTENERVGSTNDNPAFGRLRLMQIVERMKRKRVVAKYRS
jgi:hypothetical protein